MAFRHGLPLIALLMLAPSAWANDTDLPARFTAVCESAFVKSDNLTLACIKNEMPQAIQSGKRFHNTGVGAEVNALAANLHLLREQV